MSKSALTRMALPLFLGWLRGLGLAWGAESERRDAGTLILPDGGIDFRVLASVKIRLDLPREPSLAYTSRVETFLGFCTVAFRFLTKEGLDVILSTITLIAQTISFDPRIVSSTVRPAFCRRHLGGIHPDGV